MSTPIKPPGGPAGVPPPDGSDGPSKVGEASEAFRTALDAVAPEAAPRPGAGLEGVAAVAAELRAGRIDATDAVERLLDRAVASHTAAALSPEQREGLRAHLRRVLAEDPSLIALTKDLERG